MVPATQESEQPKSSEENKFLECIKNKPVSKRPVEELKEVLRYVIVKVGLRAQNWPNEMEKQILLEHIVSNYGRHTNEEIKLAFDMAITEKLEVEANCYENFSCVFFSRIMNSYRAWASMVHKNVVKPTVIMIENKEDISDEGMDKFWDATEELVAKGNYPIELIPPMLYDWMDKNGNILFSREEKLKFLERATLVRHTAIAHAFEKNPYSLETKAALNDFNRMREIKKYSEAEHEKIKELAKKMVVFEMMKTKLSTSK